MDEMYSFNSVSLQSYYRLPVVFGDGKFFININKNSIVKVHERKQLHTWTLKHPHSFTCPVVFNIVDRTVCCIVDNNVLMIWSENDDDLDSSTKIKFQDSIFAILSVANERPVIVFSSGKCMPFDHAISGSETFFGEDLNKKEKIIWSDASIHHSRLTILYLTVIKQSKKYNLYSFNLNKEDDQIENFLCQTICREKCSLKSWCMNKYSKCCLFMAIWSDGSVTSYNISSNTSESILTIPDIQPSDLLALDAVDCYHIALKTVNASKTEYKLQIWDTQFSTLESIKVLNALPSHIIQICVLDSTVFLTSNDNLAAIPIHVERSNLASSIGKLISNAKPSVNTIYKWTDDGKVQCLTSKNEQTGLLYGVKIAAEKTQRLIDNLKEKINCKNDLLESSIDLMNISEPEIIQALLYTLKLQTGSESHSDETKLLINALFCIPYSDVFLVKELRKLSFSEILIVLNVLLPLLTDSEAATANSTYKPSDYQVFSWTYQVLQSHVEEILLSKDENVVKLLVKLNKAVSKQIEKATVEEELRHLLKLFAKKDILPVKHFQAKYCIEVLAI